jgi:two-component system, sensor histidine kinase and response regulator
MPERFTHKLLARQLRRHLHVAEPDDLARLQAKLQAQADPELQQLAQGLPALLAQVAGAYEQSERDLALRTRSLELSSAELTEANTRLRAEAAAQAQVLSSLRETRNELLQREGLPVPADEASTDLLSLAEMLRQQVSQREAAQQALASSEAKYRSLLGNLPGCVFRARLDERATVRYISDGVEQLTGFPAASFRNGERNLLDLIHPEDYFQARQQYVSGLRSGQGFAQEYRLLGADGSYRWVFARGRTVAAGDRGAEVDGFIMDAHEAKRAQQEAARSRAQLMEAIESLDAGFAMYDEQERLVVCNQRYRDFYPGVAALLRPGVRFEDVVRHWAPFSSRVDTELDADAYVALRVEEFRSGVGLREALVGSRWLRVEDSRSVQGLTVCLRTDITEMKRLNLELNEARLSAETALRIKSDFLANMSHEIRTPLNGILGLNELALQARLDADTREYLQLVQSSGQSLLAIVNDILDFSKIEAGMLSIERLPVDLRPWLAQTLRPFVLQASRRDLMMGFDVAANVPLQVRIDANRLRQVLSNLLGNALKFTERGSVRVDVAVTEEGLRITVADTGIGIAPEHQARVFDAFAQADASTTRRFGGTGLGLSICARLVELMGGRIWVTSQAGAGSQFHFTVGEAVPLTPHDDLADPIKPEAPAWRRDQALALLGGDADLLAELMPLLRQDANERVSALQAAVAAQDSDTVAGLTHNLAGSADNLAAKSLAAAARDVGQAAHLQDWAGASAALQRVVHEVLRLP